MTQDLSTHSIAGFSYNVAVFAALFVVFVILTLEAVRQLLRKQKSKQSLGWPMVEMTGEKGNIRETCGPDEVTRYQLHMPYSYMVGHRRYSGWYFEEFNSLQDAQLARTTLAERKLLVRYDPANPSDSLLEPYRDYERY